MMSKDLNNMEIKLQMHHGIEKHFTNLKIVEKN